MTEKYGGQALSCDCGKSLCLYHLIIEQYGDCIGEALMPGEEPEAFLVFYELQNLKYLFSVASASGSSIHHTPKRTIVICTHQGQWSCRSCPRTR
jgi:hypothetical protein